MKKSTQPLQQYFRRLSTRWHAELSSNGAIDAKASLNPVAHADTAFESEGFSLCLRRSCAHGIGVFVERGEVRRGDVVAVYPGVLFSPGDPMFFFSFPQNHYILRRNDGSSVDARPSSLTAMVFRSNATLINNPYSGIVQCDTSWIGMESQRSVLLNEASQGEPPSIGCSLSCGHYINGAGCERVQNVRYVGVELARSAYTFEFGQDCELMSLCLLPYVPFVFPPLGSGEGLATRDEFLRGCVLESTRHIAAGEELFSGYFSID